MPHLTTGPIPDQWRAACDLHGQGISGSTSTTATSARRNRSLNLNGTVSKNSSLAVQLQANDLREVEAIADLFRTPAPGQPLQPLGLSGTASFNGVVRGSTSAPHLTGQLTAQNLQVQGSAWRLLRTNIDASPSQMSLQHAELDPAAQGRVTLNASAQLRKWSFSKSSPIQLQLNASQLDMSELAKLAGQQIPATGTLAADIKMHGSVLNPARQWHRNAGRRQPLMANLSRRPRSHSTGTAIRPMRIYRSPRQPGQSKLR